MQNPLTNAVMLGICNCAMAMLENASHILKELDNVQMSDIHRAQAEMICSELINTKHDVISELIELRELGKSEIEVSVVCTRINRMVSMMQDDCTELDQFVAKLDSASKEDPACELAYMLVSGSATNILSALTSTKEAAQTLCVRKKDPTGGPKKCLLDYVRDLPEGKFSEILTSADNYLRGNELLLEAGLEAKKQGLTLTDEDRVKILLSVYETKAQKKSQETTKQSTSLSTEWSTEINVTPGDQLLKNLIPKPPTTKDKLLSLDNLPMDAIFAIADGWPVVGSKSERIATLFSPEPSPFPLASVFSYNSSEITRDAFFSALKAVSKRRSKGTTQTKTETDVSDQLKKATENWPPDLSGNNLLAALKIIEERFKIFQQPRKPKSKIFVEEQLPNSMGDVQVLEVDITPAEIDKLMAERGPLSEELIQRIERIMPVFKDLYTPVFIGGSASIRDDWIEGFNKDLHPESEVAIWEWAAETLVTFSKSEVVTFEQFEEAFKLIRSSRMMSKADTMKQANLQILTADQVEYLLSAYD